LVTATSALPVNVIELGLLIVKTVPIVTPVEVLIWSPARNAVSNAVPVPATVLLDVVVLIVPTPNVCIL
jgi:hypothetical protein